MEVTPAFSCVDGRMTLLVEPMGLLLPGDARQAVEAGVALPLAGGGAFTLVRSLEPASDPVPAVRAPAAWADALRRLADPVPPWADLPPGPAVMGILNATPDSFSDGGAHLDPARAVEAGLAMAAAGAAVVDVGGESTRPGARPTLPEVEQARVLPIVRALARAGLRVSVDTRNAPTMAAALDAGAAIINDVSGLLHDPAAAALLARRGCPVVLMHTRGTPETMGALATYGDVAAEVARELEARLLAATQAGIAPDRIMLDPGFGFAKTAAQSAELLRRLPVLLQLGRALLVGVSRKSLIGALSGEREAARRSPGSVAAALAALGRGAAVLRVHDVAETVQAVRVWQGLRA